MGELGLIGIGVLLSFCGLRLWQWIERDEARRRALAVEAVLRRHGLTTELYVASAGVEDRELAEALDASASAGRIVIDARGKVVGSLCPQTRGGHRLCVVIAPQAPSNVIFGKDN